MPAKKISYWIVPIDPDLPGIDINNKILEPCTGGKPLVIEAYSAEQAVGYFVRKKLQIIFRNRLCEEMKHYRAVPATLEEYQQPQESWI